MTNKESTSKTTFVGVWITQQTNSFLSLYALSKRISKSELIRGLLKVWIEGKPGEKLIQELISDITARLQMEWKDKKRLYHITASNRFIIYKEDWAMTLQHKGLEQAHIKRILEGLVE